MTASDPTPARADHAEIVARCKDLEALLARCETRLSDPELSHFMEAIFDRDDLLSDIRAALSSGADRG